MSFEFPGNTNNQPVRFHEEKEAQERRRIALNDTQIETTMGGKEALLAALQRPEVQKTGIVARFKDGVTLEKMGDVIQLVGPDNVLNAGLVAINGGKALQLDEADVQRFKVEGPKDIVRFNELKEQAGLILKPLLRMPASMDITLAFQGNNPKEVFGKMASRLQRFLDDSKISPEQIEGAIKLVEQLRHFQG